MSADKRGRESVPLVRIDDRTERDKVYFRLLDNAPDAVVVVEEQGRIVLVNIQTERLFGYAREELIGQEIEALIPERFRPAHVERRTSFSHAPSVRPMASGLDLLGRKRDGTEFPVEISLAPLPTEEGVLISASIRDITDRKQQERELRRLQGHLLSAVESIQGLFAIFDGADRLVLCNSEYRQMLGRAVDGEIVGRTFEDVLDRNLRAATFNLGEGGTEDFRRRWLAYHADPSGALDVRTRAGQSLRIVERRTADSGMVATIWDVTEDVEHEEELRRARAAAEAASSAKSEFLASMSHELRTPLNAILGFAQLLQRDKKTPLSERHKERIDHVVKGGEHLLRLIDEVLDLAHVEAGRVSVSCEPVGVAEILEEVETTLHPMATHAEIALVVEPLPSHLPKVLADRTRFKQILMNYGTNAIKYGRRSGRVRFQAKVMGGLVRVSVTDDGMGIPADKQEKLFQAFHRAGQETGSIEGTGIGLAISKRFAELMAGTVGFESALGAGSEFWVELPAYLPGAQRETSESARPETRGSWLEAPDGPRYLIVYVEDNPSNIVFMEHLMADFERIELLTAPSAELGIELTRVRRPHLVIMDINLPGMSGLEATRRLQAWPETREIPVVALSAAAMVRDRTRLREAGFYRYLTKPIQVDELTEVLESVLSGAEAR